MQADREDADVLFQAVLFLREKRLSPSTAAGASAAVTARYKGKKVGSATLRRRIDLIATKLKGFVGPLPPLPAAPLDEVVANPRHEHFARYGIDAEDLKRLHAAGRGKEASTMAAEELAAIAAEDCAAVLESGWCAQHGCAHHDAPWRPVDGIRSAYATEAGEVRYVCVHHGQPEVFSKL